MAKTAGNTDESYDQKALKTLETLLGSLDENVRLEAARQILNHYRR